MNDYGPIYKETQIALSKDSLPFIIEPWNTITAIFFIFISIYWLIKISKSKNKKDLLFLKFVSFLLLIGGVGGTLYHGFRSHNIFLTLDWGPIVIIALSLVSWIIYKLTNNIFKTIILNLLSFILIFVLTYFLSNYLPSSIGISIGYIFLSLYIIIPIIIYLSKNNFKHFNIIFFSFCCFIIGFIFRTIDFNSDFIMGTHFLWHIFGLLATHLLFIFIAKLSNES